VALLVKSGAILDAPNNHGITPLQLACHKKFTNVAVQLVQAGADLYRACPSGQTAYDMAAPELKEQLRKAIRERQKASPNALSQKPQALVSPAAAGVPPALPSMTASRNSLPQITQRISITATESHNTLGQSQAHSQLPSIHGSKDQPYQKLPVQVR